MESCNNLLLSLSLSNEREIENQFFSSFDVFNVFSFFFYISWKSKTHRISYENTYRFLKRLFAVQIYRSTSDCSLANISDIASRTRMPVCGFNYASIARTLQRNNSDVSCLLRLPSPIFDRKRL